MKEIEQLKNHLERAYAEVSKLKVSGEVVDAVYEIREALRAAFRVAVKMETHSQSQAAPATALPKGEPRDEDRGEGNTSSTTGFAGGPPSPQCRQASEAGPSYGPKGLRGKAAEEGREVRADAAAEDEV